MSTNYYECPNVMPLNETRPSIFLGGGISGCADWNSIVKDELHKSHPDLVVVNPRRSQFDINDKSALKHQIKWEHDHLRSCDAILFWFCEETLCPITLYELGAHAMTTKRLFVACHPNYKRKEDVVMQLSLVRDDIKVVFSLEELVEQVREWCGN